MASAAVVLVVGARFRGQASAGTLTSRWTRPSRASVEAGFPVIETSGTPMRRMSGRMVRISAVSPEFDRASTASSRVIMPRSPWLASAGCRKNDGVPVLARVAAILPATCPDLPMPVTTTRPRQPMSRRQAATNDASSRPASAATASASMAKALRPAASTRLSSMASLMWAGGTVPGEYVRPRIIHRVTGP